MRSWYKEAGKQAIPAALCYFPLGIVYGVLFTQAGYPWYIAPIFSALVYAGAVQFLAFSLLLAGCSLLTLTLALLPLYIRHIFYGLTALKRYESSPLFLRAYLAHGLVDAPYSILVSGPKFEGKQDIHYITLLTLLIHLSWVVGTSLGGIIDQFVTLPNGLEFALTAFFAASAVEHMRKKMEVKSLAIAAISIVFALFVIPKFFFLGSMGIATAIILALPNRERKVA